MGLENENSKLNGWPCECGPLGMPIGPAAVGSRSNGKVPEGSSAPEEPNLSWVFTVWFFPWEPILFLNTSCESFDKAMASSCPEEKLEKPLRAQKRTNLRRRSGFGRCTAHQMRRCRWECMQCTKSVGVVEYVMKTRSFFPLSG